MTLEVFIENRISLIEKSKPIYFSQNEQINFGINFIYYISIFFLVVGIIFALLSSMQISLFSDRWVKSGLFYLCTLSFQLKVYGYAKYFVLKKHEAYLKQVLNRSTRTEVLLPNSLNEEFEKEMKPKSISFMQILLGSLATLGGICFLWELEFWMHFDFVIFLTWSTYALLCFHQIQKLKQSISAFILKLKSTEG